MFHGVIQKITLAQFFLDTVYIQILHLTANYVQFCRHLKTFVQPNLISSNFVINVFIMY